MQDSYVINNALFCIKRGALSVGNKTYLLSFTEAKLLELLSQNANEVVTKEQLKAYAWPHTIVTDSSLTKSMAKLRQAFVATLGNDEIIITVPRIGYKLVSDITNPSQLPSDVMPEGNDNQQQKITISQKINQKRIIYRCWRPCLYLFSVILFILSALNFLHIFPAVSTYYLNKDYNLFVEMKKGYKYQYIVPKNQNVPRKLKQVLNDLNCDCTYVIEEKNKTYSIVVFNEQKQTAVSFIVDKENVIDSLNIFIQEGKI